MGFRFLPHSFCVVLAFGFLAAGCNRKPAVDDSLFEHWLRVQLLSLNTWRLSSSANDPRNPELHGCLWQSRLDELDCNVPRGKLIPVSLRFGSGYLATTGAALPLVPLNDDDGFEGQMIGQSRGFGFNSEWRPCVGVTCRFEVFTAVEPVCANNQDVCGRAENLRISYVIKSRTPKSGFFASRERVWSDRIAGQGRSPVVMNVADLFDVAPIQCSIRGTALLNLKRDGTPRCSLALGEVQSVCRSGRSAPMELRKLGACSSASNCKAICKQAREISSKTCPAQNLVRDFWTPDLFRCADRKHIVFLGVGMSTVAEKAKSSGTSNPLGSFFATTLASGPACFLGNRICIGNVKRNESLSLQGYVPLRLGIVAKPH